VKAHLCAHVSNLGGYTGMFIAFIDNTAIVLPSRTNSVLRITCYKIKNHKVVGKCQENLILNLIF